MKHTLHDQNLAAVMQVTQLAFAAVELRLVQLTRRIRRTNRHQHSVCFVLHGASIQRKILVVCAHHVVCTLHRALPEDHHMPQKLGNTVCAKGLMDLTRPR